MTASTDDLPTKRVRIALGIGPTGLWTAQGWDGATDDEAESVMWDGYEADDAQAALLVWIEADVPIPAMPPAVTVEGEVAP